MTNDPERMSDSPQRYTGPTPPSTPLPPAPAWLDEVEGDQALMWVRERNAEADEALGGPRFEEFREQIREVLDSPDRIPFVSVRGPWAYNTWTDAEHPRGLWRRQALESYLEGGDDWDVLVDVDALAATEDRSWVWHGAGVVYPQRDRALITVSDGGSDADSTREFDVEARKFVPGGFERPAGKGSMTWIDRDAVWVLSEAEGGAMSTSGYPLQARLLRRGQDLSQALTILTGEPGDLGVFVGHDHTPGFERSWLTVAHDFYHSTTSLVTGDPRDPASRLGTVPIDVPLDADVSAWREWLLVFLHDEWEVGGSVRPAGSLLAFNLEAFLAGERRVHPLFTPDERSFLQGFSTTRHHVILTLMVDVVSAVAVRTPRAPALIDEGGAGQMLGGQEEWTARELDLSSAHIPALSTISPGAVAPLDDDRVWLTVSGYTTPTTLFMLELDDKDAGVVSSQVVRQAPAMFDAEGIEVSQHFATSADGTRVPYFQVGRPGGNASAPTVLYGYGGFEVSLQPGYSAGVGRALLERGGTYVVANIRGGGEYGPAWHRAALTEKRHKAYEDFAAVAKDLIARGVTTPSRLGIQGGSNGGLLTGNMLVREPTLFGAVIIQVPLLDMRRYHTLLAGASWMAEYGDPDDPEQWEFLSGYSPFHLFDPALAYPPALLTTSTRDDRVHPAHARTMTWRMKEHGADVTYVENIEGGHAGAADNAQRARMQAVAWEFIWQNLGD